MRSWHQTSTEESRFISTRGLCPSRELALLANSRESRSLKHTCVGIKRPVVRCFSSAEVKLILHTLVISLSGSTGRDSFNWKRSHGREHCVHVKSRSGICPARNNYPDARQTSWSFRSFTECNRLKSVTGDTELHYTKVGLIKLHSQLRLFV